MGFDRERRSEAQQATLTLRLAEAELERLRVAAAEQETSMTALFRERFADILTPLGDDGTTRHRLIEHNE